MPADDDNIEQPRRDAGGLGLGERLRSARKARALSLEQVCDALHLDEQIVLALEEERFEALGAPVFVRGHLKAYARIVGLSPDVVLEAYQPPEPTTEALPKVTRVSGRSVTINPVMWGFGVLVALLVGGLALYVFQDTEMSTPRITSPPPRSPPPTTPVTTVVPPPEEVTLPDASSSPEPAVPAVAVAEPVQDDPEPEPPPPVTDSVRLSLYFAAESWVEISDNSRRILFGLQREGIRRELTGEPPFRLLLGNAGGVQLYVNDVPYVIPDDSFNGNVARFEISQAAIE